MRIITVATRNVLPHTTGLLASLERYARDDRVRTAWPFDLHTGNAATFGVRVIVPEIGEGCDGTLQTTLVQEGVHRFDDRNPNCDARLRARIGAGLES